MLSILLPGIWDTWFNILVTSRDIENLGELIMGIFANLKGIFACLLLGRWDIWYPLCKPLEFWNGSRYRHSEPLVSAPAPLL